MSFSFKTLTTVTFVVFVTFLLTDAIQESIRRKFVKGKAVLNSFKTIQSFSKRHCLATCLEYARHDMCRIAGYNKATGTRQLSLDRNEDVLDVDNQEIGVFFVEGNIGILFRTVLFVVHTC